METAATTMTSPLHPRTRRRDAEATRDEILLAALDEFASKGLQGARVEEIAARTATSKHMIYYYFGSKDGLYAAALERAYADFRKVERAIDFAALDPLEALRTLAGNTFDVHLAKPHVVRILMSENLDSGRHVSQIDHSAQRQLVIEATSQILDRGVAQGLFRPGIDPLQLHMTLSALSFYYVSNAHTFRHVFGVDLSDPDFVALRRAEVIETIVARCCA